MDDPQTLYTVLEGFFYVNHVAPSGGAALEIAQRYLALAQKNAALAPLIVGHRLVGESSMFVGNILASRAHYDQAIALYDPTKDDKRTKWGGVHWVGSLSLRALALWLLGQPTAAQSDAAQALSIARNLRNAAMVMVALLCATRTHLFCGRIAAAKAEADEFVALAHETGEPYFKALGLMFQGLANASGAESPDAVARLESALSAYRSMEATLFTPNVLSHLAEAHARLGQFDDACRCIDDAIATIETSNERWCEADVLRVAGETSWESPARDAVKAEAYFDRALEVARTQQAKSWELRAATSKARLLRDQCRHTEAQDLLAPAYAWFTEGFDTIDLNEAKTLLDELASNGAGERTSTIL
jgi:predicted ATPase